ncbi:protein FAR1-RELATED SEQUENCE 5-like [Silene latifolia]|uniref:protein FAR1-RELATED SEQUENCE 5-like n=1 Tax=Silene latifolia TaxID=37657 RepID=UPI003D77E41F
MSKLLVCNREGFNPKGKIVHPEGVGQSSTRRTTVRRLGCRARNRLFMKNSQLLIDRFHEGHNHELVSIRDREFQKLSRNITDYHKMIIPCNSRLKIRATRRYKMIKKHVNGFDNIGARLNDFKNFHRDVKCFIHERNTKLFMDHFKEIAGNREGFYFDYNVDSDGSLTRAIWADSTVLKNYSLFGYAVSLDPT